MSVEINKQCLLPNAKMMYRAWKAYKPQTSELRSIYEKRLMNVNEIMRMWGCHERDSWQHPDNNHLYKIDYYIEYLSKFNSNTKYFPIPPHLVIKTKHDSLVFENPGSRELFMIMKSLGFKRIYVFVNKDETDYNALHSSSTFEIQEPIYVSDEEDESFPDESF